MLDKLKHHEEGRREGRRRVGVEECLRCRIEGRLWEEEDKQTCNGTIQDIMKDTAGASLHRRVV